MGEYVVKAAPDRSEYLLYNTIVDAPTYVFGSRDEVLTYLEHEWLAHNPVNDGGLWRHAETIAEHPYPPLGPSAPAERAARADETGSSSLLGSHSFGEDLMVREGAPDAPEGHGWWIPRDRLAAWCRLVIDKGEEAANRLLELRSYE